MPQQAFLNEIRSGNWEAQLQATRFPGATPELIELVRTSDPDTRLLALACLNAIGGLDVTHTALSLLEDPDPQIAVDALQVLYKHPPHDDPDCLLATYSAVENGYLKAHLARIAGVLEPTPDPAPWKALWKGDPGEPAASGLMTAIAKMGDFEARAQFALEMNNAIGSEFEPFFEAARYIADTWTIPLLDNLLERTDPVLTLQVLGQPKSLRVCDLAVELLVELTEPDLSFTVDLISQYTPEQIIELRAKIADDS